MRTKQKLLTCLSCLSLAACGSVNDPEPVETASQRIVNGTSMGANAINTPTVSIGLVDTSNPANLPRGTCGGVMVKNDVVLTAAHCIHEDKSSSKPRSNFALRVCEPDSTGACPTANWKTVTTIWQPPELAALYKRNKSIDYWKHYDFALLRLNSPVASTKPLASIPTSAPATLPSQIAVLSPQRNGNHGGDFAQATFPTFDGKALTAAAPFIKLKMVPKPVKGNPTGTVIEMGDSGSGWYAWDTVNQIPITNQLLSVTSCIDYYDKKTWAATYSAGTNFLRFGDYVNRQMDLMTGRGICVNVPALDAATLPTGVINPAQPSTTCLSLESTGVQVNVYQNGVLLTSHPLDIVASVIQPIIDSGRFGAGYHNRQLAVALLGEGLLQLRALNGDVIAQTSFDTSNAAPATLHVGVKGTEAGDAAQVVLSRDNGTVSTFRVSGTSLVEDSSVRLFPGYYDSDTLVDYLKMIAATDGSLQFQLLFGKHLVTTGVGISDKVPGLTVGGTVDVWREPINARPSAPTEWASRGFAIQSNGNVYLGHYSSDGTWEKAAQWLWSKAQGYSTKNATAMVPEYDAKRDIAALNVEIEDGSVARFAYSDAGLTVPTYDSDPRVLLTGLPTALSNDGKLLTVSGYGNATVSTAQSRLRLRFANAVPTTNPLIQIFDADLVGDFDMAGSHLRTCIQLAPDPCGALGAASCQDLCGSGGVYGSDPEGQQACLAGNLPTQSAIRTWDETNDADAMAFANNGWGALELPSGKHDCRAASNPATCASSPNAKQQFTYELRVFLRDVGQSCDTPPGINDELALSGINGFKVRSTGRVGHPTGAMAFIGYPLTSPSASDTEYDGRFEFKVAGAWAGTKMTLTDMDADDLDDTDSPALAAEMNHEISYQLVGANGPLNIASGDDGGSDCTSSSTVASNLSGNCLGTAEDENCDVEERTVCSPINTTASLSWVFSNVGAYNNVYITAPHGSPISYEIQSGTEAREKPVAALSAATWAADNRLSSLLPIVIGTTNRLTGALEGASKRITDATAAQAILTGAPTTAEGRLTQQYLTLELNRRALLSEKLKLDGAVVYGTTRSVRSVLLDAQSMLRGPLVSFDPATVERTISLLEAINLADVSYVQTGTVVPVAPTSDPDFDGIISWKDNCPATYNPDQVDSDWDGIGDACRIVPILDCVLDRGDGRLTAYLGYSSPLEHRTLPIGRQNFFTGSTPDLRQPSEFPGGENRRAFNVDFGSTESLTWKLDGSEINLSPSSTRCLGNQLLEVPFAPQTAIYASDQLVIGDGVKVLAPSGRASLVSGNYVEIGSNASVGPVFAVGNVWLRTGGAIGGSLIAGGSVTEQPGAQPPATKADHSYVASHSIKWNEPFPATNQPPIFQDSNMPLRVLDPMPYSELTVRGQVKLKAGTYYFDSLNVQDQGTLLLAQTGGPIIVYVKTSFTFRGKIADGNGGTDSKLQVGYFGAQPAFVESSFNGDIIAPNAQLVLGNQFGGSHVGRFFAKNVEVRTAATVQYLN